MPRNSDIAAAFTGGVGAGFAIVSVPLARALCIATAEIAAKNTNVPKNPHNERENFVIELTSSI